MPRPPAPPTNQRPHVVILGAGASLAACPNGDRNGLGLPLMNSLVQHLELQPILEAAGVRDSSGNFEDLYSELVTGGGHSEQLAMLEKAVDDYFSRLELPDGPTLYDHLVLSLREKDFVATFNWDPFLWQAIQRCQRIAPTPRAVALHGSVALGCCDCDSPVLFGNRTWSCERCGEPVKLVPLLYPVAQKNYASNPLIAAGWRDLQMMLGHAYALSIFGYSGPRADTAALELMKQGWGEAETRNFEQIEIIDVKPKAELEGTWKAFIYSHHWGAYPTFYDSYLLARWPRRTCEGLFNAVMQNDPDPDNYMPTGGWAELKAFLAPLVAAERRVEANPPRV